MTKLFAAIEKVLVGTVIVVGFLHLALGHGQSEKREGEQLHGFDRRRSMTGKGAWLEPKHENKYGCGSKLDH